MTSITANQSIAINRWPQILRKSGRPRDKGKLVSPVVPDSSPSSRGLPMQVSKEEILKIACNYTGYSAPNVTPETVVSTGIFNLEDVVEYGVDASIQTQLWGGEIERLLVATTDLQQALTFTGSSALHHSTKRSFDYLARLADIVYVSFNISIHDYQATLEEHCPGLMIESLLHESRNLLERYTEEKGEDEDENDENSPSTAGKGEDKRDEVSYDDCFELIDYLTATLARFLCKSAWGSEWHGQILAYLAKLATKLKITSYQPKEWATASLEAHPQARGSNRLAGIHAYRRGNVDIDHHGGGNHDLEAPNETLNKVANFMNLLGRTDHTESSPRTRRYAVQQHYWMTCAKIRSPLQRIIMYTLIAIRGRRKLSTSLPTSFEMCATLYNVGLDDLPLLVFQDMDGESLGSWKMENLTVSHAAFEILDLTMKGLEKSTQQMPLTATTNEQSGGITSAEHTPSQNCSGADTRSCTGEGNVTRSVAESSNPRVAGRVAFAVGINTARNVPSRLEYSDIQASVVWHYEISDFQGPSASSKPLSADPNMGIKPHRKTLASMNDIVTIMLPLVLASPRLVDMTTDMIGLCAHAAETKGEILPRPAAGIKASFCLSTTEYDNKWDAKKLKSAAPLSKSLLGRDALLTWHSGGVPTRVPTTVPTRLPITAPSATTTKAIKAGDLQRDLAQKGLEDLQNATKIMSNWVFEEGGVRVKCDWYVGICMFIAAILVVGGIVAGLTINERLPGVDPFNIATFCWVLAAFFILIVKSIRVAQWPWRDFLRREVLCRSVSELSSVTRIDSQLIIAQLLLNEDITQLKTRGPFNCVFSRRTESAEGFSIDEPLSMRTMLLSGLIMVQVHGQYHGEFLVCLDIRKGTDYNCVPDSNSGIGQREYIVSAMLSDKNKASEDGPIRIHLKRTHEVAWGGIVGFYNQENSCFT
ncbi:hypothetical protein K445DRAFT_380084 [Daldinia sp. EC12]|nr:hypothetical protein K445DRAFT_380084 [Daldinia sp. EC12]